MIKKNRKKSKIRYWHVTHLTNIPSINKTGLQCDEDGYIYLIKDLRIKEILFGTQCFNPDFIANNYLNIDEYVIIEINAESFNEDVELYKSLNEAGCAEYRVQQAVINPKCLTQIKVRKVNKKALAIYKFCHHLGEIYFQKEGYAYALSAKRRGVLPYEIKYPMDMLVYCDEKAWDYNERMDEAQRVLSVYYYPLNLFEFSLN